MDFEWVAIALGDVAWISLAFLLGFLASQIKLPPLVGFLAAGFILNYFGFTSGAVLNKLADLGITLLLFTVGLKLDIRQLARPQVWSVTLWHIGGVLLVGSAVLMGFGLLGIGMFADLNWQTTLLVAFAISFSSTVFVVKVLEEKGEMNSRHGSIAIGILIMQDLAAVIFLAASLGKLPSPWALFLLLLLPARYFLIYLLRLTGHGELLILYGLVLALGGAELFELGGVKDDLGALIMGVLISSHPKAKELAKVMLGFKDLFLVGFFLSIGMTGSLGIETFLIGALLVPFILFKGALFYLLMTAHQLRARTSLLASINLTNYSEFGLIVAAIGVTNGWITADWLVVIAVALSLSFVASAPLNSHSEQLYSRYRNQLTRFQRHTRLSDDSIPDISDTQIAVFGMGRVGTGAYDKMREYHGNLVVGIDFDQQKVEHHKTLGRNVIAGDPSDPDFWDKLGRYHHIELIMLALPNLHANLSAIEHLKDTGFKGRTAAIAKFPDEVPKLTDAGAHAVFNIYTEAGAGFAEHVTTTLPSTNTG